MGLQAAYVCGPLLECLSIASDASLRDISYVQCLRYCKVAMQLHRGRAYLLCLLPAGSEKKQEKKRAHEIVVWKREKDPSIHQKPWRNEHRIILQANLTPVWSSKDHLKNTAAAM